MLSPAPVGAAREGPREREENLKNPSRPLRALGLILGAWACLSPLHAQVGPTLTFESWKTDDHWADTVDDLVVTESGKNRASAGRTSTFYWDSSGRIKFPRGERDPLLSLGYEILTLDISSDSSFFDGQLNDVILVGRARSGELRPGLSLDVVAGVGNANDGHWSNSRAWYPVATVGLAFDLEEDSRLHAGLTHDGNLSLFPDLPLPYAAWRHRVSPGLFFQVGLPESRLDVELCERLRLELRWTYPLEADALLTWQPLESLESVRLFARYSRTLDGFRLEERRHRRVFYEHDRVQVGVRWISSLLDISLAGGYLLGQTFYTGHDVRSLDRIEDLRGQFFFGILIQGIL